MISYILNMILRWELYCVQMLAISNNNHWVLTGCALTLCVNNTACKYIIRSKIIRGGIPNKIISTYFIGIMNLAIVGHRRGQEVNCKAGKGLRYVGAGLCTVDLWI